MASFNEHINQSKHNFLFFEKVINMDKTNYLDWCVTICFYVSVHLINAHIAQRANLHYKSHYEVEREINPYNKSICSLNKFVYLSYKKLSMLSRRARYLLKESDNNEVAHYIRDEHMIKALKHLDSLITYFCKEHSINDFPVIEINDNNISDLKLNYIK